MFNAQSPQFYQIRLAGHLDRSWFSRFDNMVITYREPDGGETELSGFVADQSALHGLLIKIRDLNLTLIAVQHISEAVLDAWLAQQDAAKATLILQLCSRKKSP
ncbi:MAG: hypothetical protein KDJ52_19390 [Anaerolineae bacterium]|nr:hypothetical protein [Anaerolineae bacterium]